MYLGNVSTSTNLVHVAMPGSNFFFKVLVRVRLNTAVLASKFYTQGFLDLPYHEIVGLVLVLECTIVLRHESFVIWY